MPVTHGVTGSSPVRTAKANSELKQSSEIQGFQSFFFFSTSAKNSSFRQFSRGLFVGWKIQCKLPPKTKRFCPLKTFNNAPLKSLDRWGYYYFRFSSVRLNRLRNKLLANYLKSGGNELATVRISAFCVAMLSNNSFICKYSIFFRKYELSAAVL